MRKIRHITDHELAKLLRDNGAINNFKKEGNTNTWRNDDGKLIAIAFYDNAKCIRQVYLPDYVKYTEKPLIKTNAKNKIEEQSS
jgi:hypothetical protein